MKETSNTLEQLKEEYLQLYEELTNDEETVPHAPPKSDYQEMPASFIVDYIKNIDLKEIIERVNQKQEQFSEIVKEYQSVQEELQRAEQVLDENKGTKDVAILNQDIALVESIQIELENVSNTMDRFTEELDNDKVTIQNLLDNY